jgi:hypothetical protein
VRHDASCDMSFSSDVCAALPISDRLPAQPGQHGGDPPLFGRPDLRAFDRQDVAGNVRDPDALAGREVRGDRFFPWVAFEPIVLLRPDMFALERLVWTRERGAPASDALGLSRDPGGTGAAAGVTLAALDATDAEDDDARLERLGKANAGLFR